MIALVLFLLPGVTALELVRRHHHLDVATVTILVSIALGLPVLWLTWAAYRESRSSDSAASQLSLAEVADELAEAVGARWQAEVAVRRLNDPYPLPVSWVAADPSLTDPWDSLLMLASSGAGWPLPPSPESWASKQDGLAGAGRDLVDVLARVPTGRLVVLGESGAGKTMLVVRLLLDLLARRAPGGPVPVLASIASWNPVKQDFNDWLAAQLMIDHPDLAAARPSGTAKPTTARAALPAAGLILPILDGLDEIADKNRGPAIARLNDALRPGEGLVVTCRTPDYRAAVRPEDGVEVTLRGAAAIELRPLDAKDVRCYLRHDAGGPVAAARWEPVFACLGTDKPVGQALTTPLMVGLARVIYNPRPGELARDLRDPAELCSSDLTGRKTVEYQLLDAFIPAAYRPRPGDRWTAKQAESWLVFVARHSYDPSGSVLAWWQLWRAVPQIVFAVVLGLFFGLIPGIEGRVWFGLIAGIWAFLYGLSSSFHPPGDKPGEFDYFVIDETPEGKKAVRYPSINPLHDPAAAASPRALLARDRHKAIRRGLVTWLAVAILITLPAALTGHLWGGLVPGSVIGLVAGIAVGLYTTMQFGYLLARAWLALGRQLPWSLMAFYSDAHQRGVLRQEGSVYQFRHLMLQHRLATKPLSSSQPGKKGSA